jgi:serine phosphatase RsbU (regulator of sigma subunit)
VPRIRWILIWSIWTMALGLAVWGTSDAPNRGDVGLLLRGAHIGAVLPGTPAEKSTLRPGDRVQLEDDEDAHSLRSRLARMHPGDEVVLLVGEQAEQRVVLAATRPAADTVAWRLAWGAVALGFLAIAWFVGRARQDQIGMLFVLWSSVTALAVTPRPLWPTDALASSHDYLSSVVALFIPALLVHFFALFPKGRGQRRTALARGLYVAAGVLAIAPIVPHQPEMIMEMVNTLGALLFAFGCLAALVSLAVSYRTSGARHRRRLNVLLWCSLIGLAPVIAATVYSNIGPSPGGVPLQAAAVLLLLIPAGFAYAIEVHQVLDFHWRRGKGEATHALTLHSSPPVFPAGDARATVDAVASDLHARLGLSHCAVYWRNGEPRAKLITWLGDVPPDGVPDGLPVELLKAIDRLHRPANLDEVSALSETSSAQTQLSALERAGARLLVPLFAAGELRAVLALGPRLSEDLARAEWRAGLRDYSAHASLAIEHAEFHDERVHQARVDRELELARVIQERLLPSRDPSFPTFTCAGASVPSGRVCGDYYDYVELGPRRFGVAVGDVCGKGVPAALLVSHVQAALRLRALGGARPSVVLEGVNRDLARFHQPEKFVCLAYAVVDARTRTVTWANGGLNPPLLVHPERGVETLPSGDLILGIDEKTTYQDYTQHLSPGETLLFLTDGIMDARRGEEYFGETEMEACVERWAYLRAPCYRDRLLAEARAYHRTGLRDDMTVLVLQGV